MVAARLPCCGGASARIRGGGRGSSSPSSPGDFPLGSRCQVTACQPSAFHCRGVAAVGWSALQRGRRTERRQGGGRTAVTTSACVFLLLSQQHVDHSQHQQLAVAEHRQQQQQGAPVPGGGGGGCGAAWRGVPQPRHAPQLAHLRQCSPKHHTTLSRAVLIVLPCCEGARSWSECSRDGSRWRRSAPCRLLKRLV